MDAKIGKLLALKYDKKDDALRSLANDLGDYLAREKESNTPVLLLFSGGSAFSVLDIISDEVLGENVTIGVLDERYDNSNKNNNFSQLKNMGFYEDAREAGCHFIDTSVKDGQSQKDLAIYFEQELLKWYEKNSNGIIFATAGIGDDSHTSGIMPHNYPKEENQFHKLFDSEKWIAYYDAKDKNEFPYRISTTNTFLRMIDRVFVFVSGSNKKKAFAKFKKDGICIDVPSRVLKELSGSIYITSDVF